MPDSAFFNAYMRQLFLVILLLGITSLQAFSQHLAQNYNLRRKSAFIENKGQVADQNGVVRQDVKYLYSAPGLKLVLKNNSFSYEVFTLEKKKKKESAFSEASGVSALAFSPPYEGGVRGGLKEPEDVTINTHRIDVSFVGANPSPEIIADERSSDYNNYYFAHTPEDGITNVYSYSKLTYKNLYPNIDIVFYAKEEGKLKYDIVVHPGGKLEDVKMKYDGMSGLAFAEGKLKIQTALGALEEEIPYSFLKENKHEVRVKHVLRDGTVGFNGWYDRSKTLVVDPVLIWGTYYGGMLEDRANRCKADNIGNIYITGSSRSNNGIATSGAHQTYLNGEVDAFITKFSNTGERMWSTYYGGSREDYGWGIGVGSNNSIFISGITGSTSGIASTGAHQTSIGGSSDAFLVKFDKNGLRLWATYYGGDEYEYLGSVCTDIIGNVYMAGTSRSRSNIATPGTHQDTWVDSENDAFIAKFNSNGVRIWGTYYGGERAEFITEVTADTNGNVYVTGTTKSISGIASSGAHQTYFGGGQGIAFVAKFNSSGKRQWGTYYGDQQYSSGFGISTDKSGNVYVTGETISTSGIATSGAHQTTHGGGSYDAFIVKFNNQGVRQWGTYFGGSSPDNGRGIIMDKSNNIIVLGHSSSTSGIATKGAYQPNLNGIYLDAFIVKFNSSGIRLWSTYYGGNNSEFTANLSNDDSGYIYITGNTKSTSSIATKGAHRDSLGGDWDVFIAKFFDSPCTFIPKLNGPNSACSSIIQSYQSNNDTNLSYNWSINNGTIISGQGTNKIDVLWHNEDSGSVKVVVSSNDDCKDSVIKSIKINPLPLAKAGSDRTICTGASAVIGSEEIAGNTYSWSSNPAGFTSNQANPKVRPVENTTYYLTEINPTTGCTKTDSVKITVSPYPSPQPFVIGDTAHCLNSVSLFSSKSSAGSNRLWKIKGGEIISGQGTDTVTVKWLNPGKGAVKITETTTFGCTDSSEITVIINPLPDADFTFSGICIGTPTIFTATETPGVIFLWDFGDGKTSNLAASQHQFTYTGNYYVKLKVQNSSGCVDSSSKIIKIHPAPEAFAGTNKTVCHGETTKIGVEAFDDHSYSWTSIPAGFISSQADPVVAPAVTTTFYLTVKNNFSGCKNSDSVTITVRSKLADAITGSENVCVSSESDYSLETNSINNNYQWYVTNGQIVSGQNTEKVKIRWNDKAEDGTVKAVLTDTVTGCKDSVPFSVKINNPPVVNWVSTKISDKTFSFEPSDKSFLSYYWDFGDGNSSSEVSPVHTFGNYSMYQVKLTVKTGAGCEVTKESILGALINSLIVSPNPASKEATIKFTLARDMNIKIGMYDVRGREVLNITEGLHSQGIYEQKLDATLLGLSAGVYVIRMLAGEDVITKRLILLK